MSRHDSRPPGWYPDPSLSDRSRWFDGVGWTGWVSTAQDAPPPATPGPRVVPAKAHRHPWLWAPVLGLIALLLVTGAMSVAGLVANRQAAQSQTAGRWPAAGPAPTVTTPRSVEPALNGQQFTMGPARLQMPGAPFGSQNRMLYGARTIYRSYTIAEVKQKDAITTSLSTALVIGKLTEQIDPDQAELGAGVSAMRLTQQMFSKIKGTQIGTPTVQPLDRWGKDHPAAVASLEIVVSQDGTQYRSRVVMTIVQVTPNNWLSLTATDGGDPDPAAAKAVQATLDSLTFG